MYSSRWLCSLLILALLAVSSNGMSNEFRVMTEEFHPFGYYGEDGQLTGFSVEIVQAILSKLDDSLTIEVLPWARAIREIKTKDNQILFAMAKTPERAHLFKWVGPIFSDSVYLYQRSDSKLEVRTFEDAKRVDRIMVTQNFPEHHFLQMHNFNNLFLTVNPSQNIKMLMRGRGELIAVGSLVLPDLLRSMGYKAKDLQSTGIKLFDTDLYIAFSRRTNERVIERWQKALRSIENEGIIEKILNKYNLD